MKAAELESAALDDPVVEAAEKETSPVPTAEQIKEGVNATNISSVLSQMAADPGKMTQMMADSMDKVTPEMMEQARKMAAGGQGQNIMREMQRRGMDPHALRAQAANQRKALKGLGGKSSEATKQVILITKTRQLRVRKISPNSIQLSAANILHVPNPVELSCSRLAQGPLDGKVIKVWYDPDQRGVNRRARKIVGFPVGGDILIVVNDEDLTEADFLAVEATLE